MDLTAVINQLRTCCLPLGGRVGGAADFDTGIETVVQITDPVTGGLVYPVAVVIPLADDAADNSLTGGGELSQIVTETVGVIVEFDASVDRRGQGAVSQVEAMKYSLFAALLNWQINPARADRGRGLYYAGGELVTFDRARLFWTFRFSFDALVTDADGFIISGDPLTDVKTTVTFDAPNVIPIIIDDHQ